MQDVMANQVDFVFDSGLAIAHVRAGKLKLLAMAMPKRSPLFPDTPTMNELGFKDFDGSTAFGFFAPAGTPAAIVNQLNTEVNRALAIPAVREQIAGIGADTTPLSPTEFRALLQAAAKSASILVKDRNITVD
jgi:tripartite-type tricarboxylate transporter receptor subunit TctC